MKRGEKITDNHYFAATRNGQVHCLPKGYRLTEVGSNKADVLGYYATRQEALEAISVHNALAFYKKLCEKEAQQTKFRTKF